MLWGSILNSDGNVSSGKSPSDFSPFTDATKMARWPLEILESPPNWGTSFDLEPLWDTVKSDRFLNLSHLLSIISRNRDPVNVLSKSFRNMFQHRYFILGSFGWSKGVAFSPGWFSPNHVEGHWLVVYGCFQKYSNNLLDDLKSRFCSADSIYIYTQFQNHLDTGLSVSI